MENTKKNEFKVGDRVIDDEIEGIDDKIGKVVTVKKTYIIVEYPFNTIKYYFNKNRCDGMLYFHVSDLRLLTPLEYLL